MEFVGADADLATIGRLVRFVQQRPRREAMGINEQAFAVHGQGIGGSILNTLLMRIIVGVQQAVSFLGSEVRAADSYRPMSWCRSLPCPC